MQRASVGRAMPGRSWLRGAVSSALLAVAGGIVPVTPAAARQVVDLPTEDRPLSATLEDVFSVGAFDGAAWETFGDVRGVAFDQAGQLYIFDRQSSRVVVIDRSGKFVREVGKAGEGPGELRTPVAFTVLRDGTTVIGDFGHRGYSVYGPDGEFQRLVSFGEITGTISMGDLSPDPRGGAVFTGGSGARIAMSRGGPSSAQEAPKGRPIERVGLSGETVDKETVVLAWQPPRPEGGTELKGGGMTFRMAMTQPSAFEPDLLMGPLPDGGIAYSDSSAYVVKVVDADGAPQRTIRRPFQPRPVTEAMQKAERDRRLAQLEGNAGPRVQVRATGSGGGQTQSINPDAIKEMMRGQLEQLQFYPELPVVMDLATGWNGKIWVVRRGEQPTEPGAIDVLTSAGQYVGTFAPGAEKLPAAFGPDGLVAFIEKDDMEVQHVVVKRLPEILR